MTFSYNASTGNSWAHCFPDTSSGEPPTAASFYQLPPMSDPLPGVSLRDLQEKIRVMYFDKDEARGVDGTFMWLMEEVGELASALRGNDRENLAEEFADVLAWLATIANVAQVDLSDAVARKYGGGCPGCGLLVCTCPNEEKP